ncbi:hypothetical protein ACPPTR_13435 [Ralstonia pseudosolanacearum]|uniref:Probable transmembrane protein n=3 Tax=Ralstonia TaxID=48736 RepID=Q8XX37_RALN1|nr:MULTISPECIES: hypothetical protein [Ralstonia]AOE90196.1 hypothetical protein LBM341_01922 [Ralstonia solanacearum]APF86366.1 hypothetical protein BCR16_05905 [Ralstonia solanacearum FJAT-1458]UZF31127.1 hypothetical protein LGV82_05955 [Ralstonia sp. RS650]CAD15988.1 probable transmembrane protein [Ralstonia pseudosolanacearum GMI1000]AST27812.1 hypothetical protein CDC45_11620 [Ralstonia pseudosolanacearum]
MKRIALAVLGFVWGLLVTWVSVYVFNHIHWPEVQSHATGCNDMEHCKSHTILIWGMLATLLWPAVTFAILNAVAFRRWSGRKWGIAFVVLTVLVVLFYLAPYVASALGLVH